MARSLINSSRALPVTLVFTALVAFLPGWALRWTRFPAEVMRLVLGPFTNMGNLVAETIRPPRSLSASGFPADETTIERLHVQLNEFERLYLAEQSKVEDLQRQLEQLQKLPPELLDVPIQPRVAGVVLRSPTSTLGLVVLNRGANHGVKPGTVAVYDGVHLLGRVTDDVSAMQCSLLPLTNKSTGYLVARVMPMDRSDVRIADAPEILLEPDGSDAFTAQIDKNTLIEVGSTVRLRDTKWPATAQAMVIGLVESITPNELEPLRNIVTVRPVWQPSQVTRMLLKIELESGERGAS